MEEKRFKKKDERKETPVAEKKLLYMNCIAFAKRIKDSQYSTFMISVLLSGKETQSLHMQ